MNAAVKVFTARKIPDVATRLFKEHFEVSFHDEKII